MATVTIIPATMQKPVTLRVAAYCRVSSDSADQLHSYAAQIRNYTNFIEQHSGWELVDIYADEGLTGTRMDKREDFNRMLADCRKGKIDKILVKSISRFARNTKDCLVVLRELKLLNVSVQFEEDHIDTETLTSELMVSVFGSLAQQESMSISQNLRMSYRRRMEKGEFLTANPPLGYRLINGCMLTIHEEEAKVVRWIFQMYLSGKSSLEIADILTKRGVQTTDGNTQWKDTSVRYILSNEKYIGDTICQKNYTTETLPFTIHKNRGSHPQYYIEQSHPPIVSREMFDRAQKLRQSRIHEKHGTHTESPFQRKIFCGNCGTPFIRKVNKNGYVCFVCQKHNQKKDKCPVGRTSELTLQTAFVQMYNRLKCNLDTVLSPALNQLDALAEAMHRNNPKLAEVNLAIAEAAEQNQKVGKLLTLGRLGPDVCTAKQTAINAKLKQLKHRRRNILQNEDIDEVMQVLQNTYDVVRRGPEQLLTFHEELFGLLVERIIVDPNKELRFQLYGGLVFPENVQEEL